MVPFLFIFIYLIQDTLSIDSLSVAFQWKQIDFDYPSNQERWDATTSKRFIPENNLPLGLEIYGERIFITVPRWKEGVAASLAYIKKTDPQDSPLLRPYPNWDAHDQTLPEPLITSTSRVRADSCGRLWVLDSGKSNILAQSNNQVAKPKLLIFDLKTDELLRSYHIPEDQLSESTFISNIAVEDNGCDDSFGYLADLGGPSLIVYDFKQNSSWIVKHHYFSMDPLAGNMSLAGLRIQWTDGLFGLALSDKDAEGFSTLYFHPMISFNEFTVSTKVLRNPDLATNQTANFKYFKLLGTRGPKTQSGTAFLHQKSGVLFYALIHLNAVACWRTSLPNYTMESQGRVFLNDNILSFPSDIKVDANDTLWVLSDKLPVFMHDFLNYREYNFRILNGTVKEAIKGTPCDSKMKIDHHIMKNITSSNKSGSPSVILRPDDFMKNANKKSSASSASFKSEIYLLVSIFVIVIASR